MSVFFTGLLLLFVNIILFFLIKNKNTTDKILHWYLVINLIEAITCFCIFIFFPKINHFISHLYFFVHFTFLSYFYYNILDSRKIKKFIPIAFVLVYLIITISYIINPKIFLGFNLFEIILVCLLLVTYAFLLVFQTLETEKKYFYFSIGIIIYFSISCLVFLSGSLEKILIISKDPYIDHWIIKDLFYFVFQIYIFKEYLFIKKKRNELSI